MTEVSRPRPPEHLTGHDGMVSSPCFVPARELEEWARVSFINEDAPLFNPDHAHLVSARLGFLWTNVPNSRGGRAIAGQAEFQPPGGSMGKWARARATAQILGWFGEKPDFLLTFWAEYAAACSDAEFCALTEHELYHCGQARDVFGAPKFSQSGLPVFAIRGHDVEEFNGIVRRYGAEAAHITEMIEAASQPPLIAEAGIRGICGTCHA